MLDASGFGSDPGNVTFAWVCAFVDELQRQGVRHVVICPGSRSTPLALAFADQPAIRHWVLVDERSAAFFALGIAKNLAQPVALLCTSGTAAANFFPAVIESKLSYVPLLVLTADRPHELRECGAPQTIDQIRLYGGHVKWFFDLALPEATNESLRFIRTIAGRAVALACANPIGPVHLNFPLRELFMPTPTSWETRRGLAGAGQAQDLSPQVPAPSLLAPEARDAVAWQGRPSNAPYIDTDDAPLAVPSIAKITSLGLLLRSKPHGLIIVGPHAPPNLAEPLLQLAHLTNYPILADPLSQIRCGLPGDPLVLSSYDAFLRDNAFVSSCIPDIILRIGAMPTAKTLLLYIERYKNCHQIVIDGHGEWLEPTLMAAEMIHTDPVALCLALLAWYRQATAPAIDKQEAGRWCQTWLRADRITHATLTTAIEDLPQFFEGRIFTELRALLPANATLYVGNSMPIRDLDTFFWCRERPLRIVGNRGANGIDGIISSALGVAATTSSANPTVLVIGDLSFFHDLNGLLAAHLYQLDLVIVLINNNGGGIFSFLPQAAYPRHFERLFGTPTELNFKPVIHMYGGDFQRVESWEQFRRAIQHGLQGGLHVVEVPTERNSNVVMHRQLWQEVKTALASASGRGTTH